MLRLNRKKQVEIRKKRYWLSFSIIWGITIIIIIGILMYNSYLSRTYLRQESLNFINALQIVNDPWYFFWFFVGLTDIFSLIGSACYIIIKELNYTYKASSVVLLAPIINLVALIILIYVYSNPILLAFAFVVMIGGAFMFISSAN